MGFSKFLIERVVHALTSERAADELLADEPVTQSLEFLGKGQGATKTTTATYGVTITEEFGIGDELFLHWIFSPRINRSLKPKLHLDLAPAASEVGKLVSIRVDISAQVDPANIGDTGEAFFITDVQMPDTALDSVEVFLELPQRIVKAGIQEAHIKLTRVAATSDDLASDMILHHASVDYYKEKG
jgi:hypothetical protein